MARTIGRNGIFLLVLMAGCAAAGAETDPSAEREPAVAGRLAAARLSDELAARGVDVRSDSMGEDFRQSYALYDAAYRRGVSLDSAEFRTAAARMNRTLARAGIESFVKVTTAKPGARVRYRLIGESTIQAFGPLTNKSEGDIPIGLYYFWAERSGTPTSRPLYQEILRPRVDIELEEASP
jgi:hypothetical protein